MYINEAALIAQRYGYGVTAGPGRSIFIMRKSGNAYGGDIVALIKIEGAGEIIPQVEDYNEQDHLIATAIYKAGRRRR